MNWIELLGYFGSGLVALSLMMGQIRKLRIINLIGATVFAIYGVLIAAFPVFFLNFFIVMVDAYYLWKMGRVTEYFGHIEVDPKNAFFQRFLDFQLADIQKINPEFSQDTANDGYCHLMVRDMNPAGIFIYSLPEDDTVFIHLDYVTPEYRDLRSTKNLFQDKIPEFKSQGYQRLKSHGGTGHHREYLKKMGFLPMEDDPQYYIKPL